MSAKVEDVSRLLLQAQHDIEVAKRQLEAVSLNTSNANALGNAATDPSSPAARARGVYHHPSLAASTASELAAQQMVENLKYILSRTQTRLRSQTEALRTVQRQDSTERLPAIRGASMDAGINSELSDLNVSSSSVGRQSRRRTNSGTSPIPSGTGARHTVSFSATAPDWKSTKKYQKPLSVGEKLREDRKATLMNRFDNPLAREIIAEQFGIPVPTPEVLVRTDPTRVRPIEQYGRESRKVGKVRSSHTAPTHVLPAMFRKDPSLANTAAEEKSRAIMQVAKDQGVYELQHRGFLPTKAAAPILDNVLSTTLTAQPAKFHDYFAQFDRCLPTSQILSTDLADFKLNLLSLLPSSLSPVPFDQSQPSEQTVLRIEAPPAVEELKSPAKLSVAQLARVRFDAEAVSLASTERTSRSTKPPPPPEEEEPKETDPVTEQHKAVTELLALDKDVDAEIFARLSLPASEKERDYDQLLDEYSLHRFIIRRGYTLDSTPEFRSFRRKFSGLWNQVLGVIAKLERLLRASDVSVAFIDGVKVVALAEQPGHSPNIKELVACVVNQEEVIGQLKNPEARYMGPGGRGRAATVIQATYKMHRHRVAYKRFLFLNSKAKIIQQAWRIYKLHQTTRQQMGEAWVERLRAWRENVDRPFRERWQTITEKRRVVVHMPSLSLTAHQRHGMHNFAVRENAQMTRFADVLDPRVDVLYVSPFPVPPDVQAYYYKLMEIGGIANVRDRFKIISPPFDPLFPSNLSVAQQVYYTPRTLKQIKDFIRGRPAYLVPYAVGLEDMQVAVTLQLPILGPDHEKYSLFASKSGNKRIFAAAEVSVPPGVHDVYDSDDLFTFLARMIVRNMHVTRWLLKIDDESGGRGIAHFEPATLKVYRHLWEDRNSGALNWKDSAVLAAAEEKLKIALRQHLPNKVVIACPQLYNNSWTEFSQAFFRVGGVIEACPPLSQVLSSPSVNLLIEPDGTVSVTSTHDQIFSAPYIYCGATFPSQFHHGSLHQAAMAVGRACFHEGIIGHAGLDFVVFRDDSNPTERPQLRMWAVDLNLRVTETAASFKLFNFLMQGQYHAVTPVLPPIDGSSSSEKKLDMLLARMDRSASTSNSNGRAESPNKFVPQAGQYYIPPPAPLQDADPNKLSVFPTDPKPSASATPLARGYSVINYLYHPALSAIPFAAFFNLCRFQNISFDLKSKRGTAFVLMDSLASGSLGTICIDSTPQSAMYCLLQTLGFLDQQTASLQIAQANSPSASLYQSESNVKTALAAVKSRSKVITSMTHSRAGGVSGAFNSSGDGLGKERAEQKSRERQRANRIDNS